MQQHQQEKSSIIVTEELRRIAEAHGGLARPEDIVEAAQSEDSPLHPKFTWDDSVAGHQFRLWQARQLLRICIAYQPVSNKMIEHNVFVSLSTDRMSGGGYRIMTDVLRDDEARQIMLADALRELHRIQRQFRDLRELERVFQEIDKVEISSQA